VEELQRQEYVPLGLSDMKKEELQTETQRFEVDFQSELQQIMRHEKQFYRPRLG